MSILHISTMSPALSSVVDSYRMLDPSNILASPKLIRCSLTVSHFCCSIHQTYWKLKDQIQNIVQPLRTRYPTASIYPPLALIWVSHAMLCHVMRPFLSSKYPVLLAISLVPWKTQMMSKIGRREDQPSVAFTSLDVSAVGQATGCGSIPIGIPRILPQNHPKSMRYL